MKRLKHSITIALLLASALLALAGCGSEPAASDDSATSAPNEQADAPPLASEDDDSEDAGEQRVTEFGAATYELVFEATWSEDTHPTDFPPDPHFSGLIGAVHSVDSSIWMPSQLASAGMKNMAETGGKSPLDTEIEDLIDRGMARELISGSGINPSPGQTSVTFTVNDEHPLVSVVTMIAPSPDWFVGVAQLDLRDQTDWSEQITVEMLPWDAGTDDGLTYASENAPTSEHMPIFEMDAEPPISVDGAIPAFGTMSFTRVE